MSRQHPTSEDLSAAHAELNRALRSLVELFAPGAFKGFIPVVQIEPIYQRRRTLPYDSCSVVLQAHDLARPRNEILSILLHQLIHAAHASHGYHDLEENGHHNVIFQAFAEEAGLKVAKWRDHGWAMAHPRAALIRYFDDIQLGQNVLRPFGRLVATRPIPAWRCNRITPHANHSHPRPLPRRAVLAASMRAGSSSSPASTRGKRAKIHAQWRRQRYVPLLRLSGQWLARHGFHIHTGLEIEADHGKLSIRALPADRPQLKSKPASADPPGCAPRDLPC